MSSLFSSPSKQATAAAQASQGISQQNISELENYISGQQGQLRTAIGSQGPNPYFSAAQQMNPSTYASRPGNTINFGSQGPGTSFGTNSATVTAPPFSPPVQPAPSQPPTSGSGDGGGSGQQLPQLPIPPQVPPWRPPGRIPPRELLDVNGNPIQNPLTEGISGPTPGQNPLSGRIPIQGPRVME